MDNMDRSSYSNIEQKSVNDEDFLIAFYNHEFDCLIHSVKHTEKISDSLFIMKLICNLLNHTCKEIITILQQNIILIPIEKKDIPQFSNFYNAWYRVPYLLKNCGIDGVEYKQMGYMLRNEKSKELANFKYGENHLKTAEQLCLCKIEQYKAYITNLGLYFLDLTDNEQKSLLPRLCLHIPFIENYYISNESEIELKKGLSILSPSTSLRRLSNVKTLIETIDNTLNNEL